jgi:hypothetical protein
VGLKRLAIWVVMAGLLAVLVLAGGAARGLEDQQQIQKDGPPLLEGGVWSDPFLPGYFSHLENAGAEWGFLELKLIDLLRWRQTWTAHFAPGEFLHTEAISDSVRLAPAGPGLFHTTGVYTSTVFDAGRPVDWAYATWVYTPEPPAVELEYRTGAQASPDDTWSEWTSPLIRPGEPLFRCSVGPNETDCHSLLVGIESNRYLQYRATFSNDDASQGAALLDIEIGYGLRALSGTAVSAELAPLDLAAWETVFYTATAPLSTAVQIDVLAGDGTVLQPDVGNGESLAGIDPLAHPALKLRARLSSEVDYETPYVDAWGLRWQTTTRVYLPLVAR